MMSKSIANLAKPEVWISGFILDELKTYDVSETAVGRSETTIASPIVPLGTNTGVSQEFYDLLVSESPELSNPLIIGYDKLMRFRTSPFYRIKKEQVIYEVFHQNYDIVDNVTRIIEQMLDREDIAAQEINAWAANKQSGTNPLRENPYDMNSPLLIHNVFFHKIRVYKVDESRDLVELNSTNLQFARNKIIVEFDYHDHSPNNYD